MEDRYRHPDILAPRHVLLNSFHRASARRLCYVSAGGGWGKTVSTMLWAKDSGRKHAWMPLGRQYNTPATFYKTLCEEISAFQPGNQAMHKILASPNFSSSPIENTRKVIGNFNTDENLYALLIDDMHLIDDEEILKSLPHILLSLPHSFVSFVLSRKEPSGEFLKEIEKGRAAHITVQDLAFTKEEIGHYFKIYGQQLTDDEVTAVHAMTGGWSMGVGAFALSGSISLGTGNHQTIEPYLQTHVWQQWESDLRQFMMRTAIVDEMTAELCNRLTGRSDSEAVLNNLCSSNIFIVHNQTGIYRYHHLFLNFLRNKLKETDELDERQLCRQAAQYYHEKHMLYDALRFAVKGKHYEGIESGMFELYQYGASSSSVAAHANMLKNFLLDIIPDKILEENPFLLINYIWYHYLMGDVKNMLHYIDRFYENFDTIRMKYHNLLELGFLITTLDVRKPPTGIMLEQEFPEGPIYGKDQTQTITLTENMPYMHRSNRDYSQYVLDLDENMYELSRVFGLMLDPDTLKTGIESIRSGLLYEQSRLKEAAVHADIAVAALVPETGAEMKMTSRIIRASIYFAEGRSDAWRETMEMVKYLAKKENSGHLIPNITAIETKFRLMDANKKTAQEWLSHYYVTESEQTEFHRFYQHLTTARAYLVLNRTDKAARLIDKLKQMAMDYRRPLDIAETSVLQAALQWSMGNKEEAQKTLEQALSLMQHYGFLRVFADEGASVLPILKKILNDMEKESYRGVFRYDFVNRAYALAQVTAKRCRGVSWNISTKPVKLSKQQKKLLTLMARGYKQAQISQMTGLAIPTIKSHLYVTYKKLDVGNSTNAILKAENMGLIE